jgi:hypothetical protein
MCGKVRYTSTTFPQRISHCFCVQCRKASGCPFQSFAIFPRSSITWVNGPPQYFRYSNRASRGFCATCGSSLTFEADDLNETRTSIAPGSFDDWEVEDGGKMIPKPVHYLFVKEKPVWFDIPNDGLELYEGDNE